MPFLKPKGLWFTSIILHPALHGNSVYTNELTKKLSKHFYLDLLYYPSTPKMEGGTINNLKQFKNIYFIKKEKAYSKPVFTEDGRNKNFNFINKSVFDWLKQNFNSKGYKFIICDYIFLTDVFDILPKSTTKIINTHDIWGDRHLGLKWNDELKRKNFCCTEIEEIIAARKSNILITISEHEKKIFKKRMKFIKNKVSINTVNFCPKIKKKLVCSSRKDNKLKIGFIASDNNLNKFGINEFIKFLSEFDCQNIELHLAGLISDSINFKYDWIIKKGILTEKQISEFYNSVDIVVNPMQSNSTGLKIKTVMAIINGLPIVGTKDAFSGMKITSKWHLIDSIENLAKEIYIISLNKKLIEGIKKASEKLGQDFIRQSELQINKLILEIKKEINLNKKKDNFFKKSLPNREKVILEKNDDSKLDYFERYNNTKLLAESTYAFRKKIEFLLERIKKLENKSQKLLIARERINELDKQVKERTAVILNLRKEIDELKGNK